MLFNPGVRCAICGEVLEGQVPVDPLNHDFVEVSRKEPTETETGFIKFACTRCGVTMQKKLPALGHEWQLVEEAEPTCEAEGYKLYYCTYEDCDETLREAIPALGHTYGEWVTTKAPTCHEVGMSMSACTRCELAKAQYLPQLEHVAVTDAAIEPTCTSTGLTEGSHCLLCGDVFTAQEIVLTIPHTEVFIDEISATCEQSGISAGVRCTVCDQKLSGFETIKALGHLEVVEEGTPAFCTEPGLTDGIHCERCGKVLKAQLEAAPRGHDYVKTDYIAATCTTEGSIVYVCSRCEDSYSERLLSLGHIDKNSDNICDRCGKILNCKHNWGEWAFPDGYHCDVGGEVSYTCTICGKAEHECTVCHTKEDVTIVAGQHPKVALKTIPGKAATCTEKGKIDEIICEFCGTIIQVGTEISPLGHVFEWTELNDATCKENGHRKGVCTVCGTEVTEVIPNSSTGDHTDADNDGYCDTCEQQMTGGDHCKYCGQIHGGAFGWLTKFFHSILALFGARK